MKGGIEMAIVSIKESRLRLTYQVGTDETGNPIYRVKTYNNVKPNAQADQLLLASKAISSLANAPLMTVERNDIVEITE